MSSITDIDPSLYNCYAFTAIEQPFELSVRIDSGYANISNYDLFDIESGTVIAFKGENIRGFHDVKISGNQTDYIQTNDIKILNSVLNEEQISGYNFYVFCDSQIMNSQYQVDERWFTEDRSLFIRCDYQKLGASAFYPAVAGYNITKVFNLLSVTGVGHIVRFETSNDRNMNPGTQSDYTAAKTFSGILKLISEWDIASKEPFNNQEDIAIKANLFIENLNMNGSIWNDINSTTGDLPLARYIRGNTDRFPELEDTCLSPDSLKDYLKSHCVYHTLVSLDRTLNLNIFDEAFTNKYRSDYEKMLLSFCYSEGVDIENFENLDELLNLNINNIDLLQNIILKYKEILD
jgi:hypothetical protein